MTRGNGDTRAASRSTSGLPEAGRGGLTEDAAAQLALIVGFVVFLAVTVAAQLLLDNSEGPLGESATLGKWGALGCGALTAIAALAVTQLVARRSSPAVGALLVAWAVAAVVLFPRPIDVSESWVPRPNERYACIGWAFRYYPPGTMDASSTTYCIGFERRIADG